MCPLWLYVHIQLSIHNSISRRRMILKWLITQIVWKKYKKTPKILALHVYHSTLNFQDIKTQHCIYYFCSFVLKWLVTQNYFCRITDINTRLFLFNIYPQTPWSLIVVLFKSADKKSASCAGACEQWGRKLKPELLISFGAFLYFFSLKLKKIMKITKIKECPVTCVLWMKASSFFVFPTPEVLI